MRFYTGQVSAERAGKQQKYYDRAVEIFTRTNLLKHGLQVLLRGTSNSMLIDIACLDSTGAIIAELPAVCFMLHSTHNRRCNSPVRAEPFAELTLTQIDTCCHICSVLFANVC